MSKFGMTLKYMTALCAAVFLLAGALKAANMDQFYANFPNWNLIPISTRQLIAVGVPAFEIIVACLWIFDIKRMLATIFMICFLIAVSFGYLYQAYLFKPIPCGCFNLSQHPHETNLAVYSLRNAAIILILGAYVWFIKSGVLVMIKLPTKSNYGSTLLEALAVLSILSVLVLLLIPAASKIRTQAVLTKSLTSMSTHNRILALYAADNRDIFPYFADPYADRSVVRGAGNSIYIRFFEQSEYWFLFLTDYYYDSSLDQSLFSFPTPGRGNVYAYSSTLFTSPYYWRENTREGPSQWTPVRMSQVAYPSLKASFTESYGDGESVSWPIWSNREEVLSQGRKYGFSFIDGSASRVLSNHLILPYRYGDGGGEQTRFGTVGIVGVHTVNGVLGRDRK